MDDVTNVDAPITALIERSLRREPNGAGRAASLAAWVSTRGLVRTDNQDRLAIGRTRRLTFATLADGMGGMKDGARAATVAASAVVRVCLTHPPASLDTILRASLLAANEAVYGELKGQGGAAVVLLGWADGELVVAHAGDARAYLIRLDGQLVQLTADDTVRGQLEQLGRRAGDSAKLEGTLLQFVGMGRDFEPHVSGVQSQGGRGVLLTSDGVHSIPSDIMAWISKVTAHAPQLVSRLVTASEWHGGRDNATVVSLSLQNLNTDKAIDDLIELWIPGEHSVLPEAWIHPPLPAQPPSAPVLTDAGSAPKASRAREPQTTRRKNPRKRNASKKARAPREPLERNLPIMAFEGTALDDQSDSEPPATEGTSNAADPTKKRD